MTTPTTGAAELPEALKHAEGLESFAGQLPAYGFNPQPLKDAATHLRRQHALLNEQLWTIKALNACINGEGSTTTDNLRLVDRLHAENEALRAQPAGAATPAAQEPLPAEAVERIVHLRANREKRVYIAGPMTGLPEFNFPAFNRAAARLRHDGWHVENPAEHGHVEGAGWADYLRWDISRIATCGAIYLLPGWSKSKGAILEVHIAQVLDLRVIPASGAEQPPSPQPAVTAGAVDALRTAAQAVVDRWDTPLWKDAPATAEYIGMLRAALAAQRATHQGDHK